MPASPYDKILGKQPVFFLPEKDWKYAGFWIDITIMRQA